MKVLEKLYGGFNQVYTRYLFLLNDKIIKKMMKFLLWEIKVKIKEVNKLINFGKIKGFKIHDKPQDTFLRVKSMIGLYE